MSRQLFKKWLPDVRKIKQQKSLKVFGSLIYDSNLWHLNRYSIAKAFSVGMIWAWVPIPFQMLCSAATAIILRANLPLSVALVWITNPLTMPALYYFAYRVGRFILGVPPEKFTFELSWEWLGTGLLKIWQPFLLGCFVCGVVSAISMNLLVRLLWRYSVSRHWEIRKLKHQRKRAERQKAKYQKS